MSLHRWTAPVCSQTPLDGGLLAAPDTEPLRSRHMLSQVRPVHRNPWSCRFHLSEPRPPPRHPPPCQPRADPLPCPRPRARGRVAQSRCHLPRAPTLCRLRGGSWPQRGTTVRLGVCWGQRAVAAAEAFTGSEDEPPAQGADARGGAPSPRGCRATASPLLWEHPVPSTPSGGTAPWPLSALPADTCWCPAPPQSHGPSRGWACTPAAAPPPASVRSVSGSNIRKPGQQ